MSKEYYTGQLLVASPVLRDPNFARSVVLLLDHDSDGALGVVVNRPTELPVTSVLESWTGLVCEPEVLFQGGPVATDSALGLAKLPPGGEGEPVGWKRLYDRLGLVDLDAPPELLAGGLEVLRVFAGYAGWSPGQLEVEIKDGGWYVVDAEQGDAFTADPASLWRRVLRRQRGELALVATFPDDPTMN
jgi:putative transcriptional regulator